MAYSEKLKDPRWQKKRLEILERDSWSCQICGDSESTLHVHHYKYENDPWEVDNIYLKTLCESCHEMEHHDLKLYKKNLSDELLELESDCYFSLCAVVHYLKENSKYPNQVSFSILADCFIDDPEFFNEYILPKYYENKRKNKVKK